ncbi:TauD/TfdA family dioxygenase [Nocardioides sp.]|uniref:TauD/TfdA family dioxygenase n=1 Tax=Nocardioides sp. TaxID=35761 RepID=UPI0039E35B54
MNQLIEAGTMPPRCGLPEAREIFAEYGAVVMPSPSERSDTLVEVAALLLGSRLRRLFPIRRQDGESGDYLGPHADGAWALADVHGQTVRLRDPDDDYVLQRCLKPAAQGGESFVLDGYRLADRIRETDTELHEFLTGVDVDFLAGWTNPSRGVPATPLLRRMIEHTRGGRRVVRTGSQARPAPREPDAVRHQVMLDRYAAVVEAMAARAPRFRLDAGDVLVLDNYRYLHGRDAFVGARSLQVTTVVSTDAWSVW